MQTVLILGSGPMAAEAARWPRAPFDAIIAINNAHNIRPDWDFHIHPWDFPAERRPVPAPGQHIVTEEEFVAAQNALGGFVYAGGTMAFTTIFWALHTLAPRVIAVFGCDMHYPAQGPTHFYGRGTPDPLRNDITLRSLQAKSGRALILAAMMGTALVNLSRGPSRLVFPRMPRQLVPLARPVLYDARRAAQALALEEALGYHVPSGRYWEEADRFDPAQIDRLDALWLDAASHALARQARAP